MGIHENILQVLYNGKEIYLRVSKLDTTELTIKVDGKVQTIKVSEDVKSKWVHSWTW